MQQKSKKLSRKRWEGAVSVGIVILLALAALFGFSLRQIYVGVETICQEAKEQYDGDHVEALLALVKSDDASFKKKNRAIWALGQIGDKRALPLLRELDTKKIQKKPYDSSAYIVQYSVEKAIRLIESSFTLTRWMYKKLK